MPGTPGPAGPSGTLYVVATPIGNLEDVTGRAIRVLREVALIAAEDTRRTAHLLARYDVRTPTTSLHQHNEGKKADELVRRLAAGESVALVSDAGTPTVSDPGSYLIRCAADAGVRVEAIPGPSAVLTLLACAALPTDRFTFLGFPPNRSNDRDAWFRLLGEIGHTVVFYEAPHRISDTLTRIRFNYGNCHIVVGRELTKLHEQVVRGTIDQVLGALGEPVGEFCVAINLVVQQNQVPIVLSDDQILAEYERCLQAGATSKRRAIQAVGKNIGLSTNLIYEALERHKKSGK